MFLQWHVRVTKCDSKWSCSHGPPPILRLAGKRSLDCTSLFGITSDPSAAAMGWLLPCWRCCGKGAQTSAAPQACAGTADVGTGKKVTAQLTFLLSEDSELASGQCVLFTLPTSKGEVHLDVLGRRDSWHCCSQVSTSVTGYPATNRYSCAKLRDSCVKSASAVSYESSLCFRQGMVIHL